MKGISLSEVIKNISLPLALLATLACAVAQKPEIIESPYNSAADIDLFLSTSDKKTENQELERLKSNGVGSIQIKQL